MGGNLKIKWQIIRELFQRPVGCGWLGESWVDTKGSTVRFCTHGLASGSLVKLLLWRHAWRG